MDRDQRTALAAVVRRDGTSAIHHLAAAETAILRGQFNLAKVLRAVAHAQRISAMRAARLLARAADPTDWSSLPGVADAANAPAPPDSGVLRAALGDQAAVAAQVQERIDDLLRRARASLASASDVPERAVAQHLWGCYGCGYITEGDRPDRCPICGALGVEFEWFGPFYTATPEHLGQLDPAAIRAVLAAIPDELAALVVATPDAALRRPPAPGDWCVMEIVGHMIETDRLFARRVRTVLAEQGLPNLDTPTPPWKLQEGKGYQDLPVADLLDRLREARAASLALVRDLAPEAWARRGIMRAASTSLLDLGTWLANHDRGHLAQVRRLCANGRAGAEPRSGG